MAKTNYSAVFKKYAMAIVLVLVIILFYVLTKGAILLPQNINNLLSQNAYVFVLATGMLLCILTGGNIDLAVGSVVCFAGAVGGVVLDKDMNFIVAFLIMILIGLAIGMWQGFWIAFVNVPPFIATLAGMYAFRGLSNVVLGGQALNLSKMDGFLNTFGGGANCYIPGSTISFLGNDVNVTSKLDKVHATTGADNSTNSLVGIDLYFNSHNNAFLNNNIFINSLQGRSAYTCHCHCIDYKLYLFITQICEE